VTEFVARQTATLAGISRGLDDMAAGRLIDHDLAMDELDAEIERTARHAR
jgi:predicted transcriptional regulator